MARSWQRRDSPGDSSTLKSHESHDAVAAVFREEAGRLTAWLMRMLGDLEVAEEIVQDAMLAALRQWPNDGIPETPRAWLRTVARRRAIDHLRRETRLIKNELGLAEVDHAVSDDQDNRLELIFMCCHPALNEEVRVALTLKTVCGLTTAQIARAFLVSEATVAQRIVRAKRKIVAAKIPYRLPRDDELDERLAQVLEVLYLTFNEGYLSGGGDQAARREVAEDAAWLAELLAKLFPNEPEVLGLLALMRLHLARASARFDDDGELVLLRDQDRRRWERSQIAEAVQLLERAASLNWTGPFQLQAAIAACHAEAESWAATDWPQILILYDLLLQLAPTPIARLNRAVAVMHVLGPDTALEELRALAKVLDSYHLYHAVRGEVLRSLGQFEAAHAAEKRALELTSNPAEQALIRHRLQPGAYADSR